MPTDNSKSLSVRMTQEQLQRLRRYLPLTGLPVTTYFRKLIHGGALRTRMSQLGLDPHPGVNHICSNVCQIARCPRARALAPEQVKALELPADLLCEESYLLCGQK